ncbi:hypothetical protein Taro_041410, partial [Colocasia esculenta]|nr:hypothetical protein [Colocasia esculenta]
IPPTPPAKPPLPHISCSHTFIPSQGESFAGDVRELPRARASSASPGTSASTGDIPFAFASKTYVDEFLPFTVMYSTSWKKMIPKISVQLQNSNPTQVYGNFGYFLERIFSGKFEGFCGTLATLNDSFLADLDELSDNEDHVPEDVDADLGDMEEDIDGDIADIEALNYDDLDSVSKLQKTQRYIDIMQKVDDALQKGQDIPSYGMVLEDDPEYQLIVDCNALSVDIENEIIIIHNFIRDNYRLKFPELESLVHHPIDYARVVKKIGNEMDLTLVDLEGLLPSAIIMVVSVTASTTSGKPLPEENLKKTIDACDRALALDSDKKKVLDFVESRMGYIAPNLSAIVGTAKSTLAARVDSTRGDPTGKTGRDLREEIRKKIEKWQEPPPAKQPKPLPVPDSEPKKKRGGRRLRKMKERYAVTDMRKLANRMLFGIPEESSLGDGLGEGYGMLGQAGSGKLRVSVAQSKLAVKAAKRFKEKQYGSSGATSGLTSSLAFTPVQGIELTNPQAHGNQLGSGTQSTYFSETGTFSKIKRT